MGELETIRTFLAVVREGSFAGAARALGLTPASVTRSVAALEDQLGLQLLLRTTRQVSLTSAGAVYAARVGPLVAELADATAQTRDQHGVPAGRLRLSAPLSLGLKALPDMLAGFRAAHPGIALALTLSDGFVDIVEGAYDLAIRISGPPSDKSTIWRKICPVPRVLVAAPSYLARHGTPDGPDALAAHECLAYGSAGEETWVLTRGPARRAHRAGGGIAANNGDLLAQMACAGAGIALLPRFIVAEDLAAGRLVPLLTDWHTAEIWLTLYYPPYERLPLTVATFSDWFEGHIGAAGVL